jgi:hypothetical protein
LNTWSALLTALAVMLASQGTVAAEPAGEVVIARGVVTAYSTAGDARIVGMRSEVFGGEVISTGARSLVLLKLADGTRITLRPETTFEITEFNTQENEESALFTLFKGGLRSVTGYLSKRNPNAMRLKTSVATIGIRGTEFDARLCGTDCAAEAARRPAPAGRAGFVKGRVLARASGGSARTLAAGAPVYSGDTLISDAGAWAVVAFRDDSRITILPNTEFRVESLRFDAADPEAGSAAFRLLRGGLRAVTGLIGKRGYRMHTAVATIGIRGTGYDAVCQGSCQNPDPGAGPDADGLFAAVWDGEITLDDVHVVESGQVVFLSNTGFAPVPVSALPMELVAPPPNTVDLPPPPPSPTSSTDPDEGLYVSCYAGTCALQTDDNVVELGAGEAGHVGSAGGPAEALDEVPPFQAEDPLLQSVEIGEIITTLDESLDGGVLQCTVR